MAPAAGQPALSCRPNRWVLPPQPVDNQMHSIAPWKAMQADRDQGRPSRSHSLANSPSGSGATRAVLRPFANEIFRHLRTGCWSGLQGPWCQTCHEWRCGQSMRMPRPRRHLRHHQCAHRSTNRQLQRRAASLTAAVDRLRDGPGNDRACIVGGKEPTLAIAIVHLSQVSGASHDVVMRIIRICTEAVPGSQSDQVSGMICIRPMAPLGDRARGSPKFSPHDSANPGRRN